MKMSSSMLRRILGVLVVAVTASLPGPAGAAGGQPQYKVMMVLWRGCEDACRGFQDYLRSRDLPVEFLMRDVKQDASAFPGLVAEARALHVDLVVTWGTTVTLGMVSTYDKVDPSINL